MGLLKRISNLQILKNHHFGNIHSSIPQKKQFFFFWVLFYQNLPLRFFWKKFPNWSKKPRCTANQRLRPHIDWIATVPADRRFDRSFGKDQDWSWRNSLKMPESLQFLETKTYSFQASWIFRGQSRKKTAGVHINAYHICTYPLVN